MASERMVHVMKTAGMWALSPLRYGSVSSCVHGFMADMTTPSHPDPEAC